MRHPGSIVAEVSDDEVENLMSSHYRVTCPECGKPLKVPTAALGRKGKCPHCERVIRIPAINEGIDSAVGVSPLPGAVHNNQIVTAELAEQPSHSAEFASDRRRMLDAVSVAPDKFALIEPYLMEYEKPVALAVQRQFPFSVFADIVLLSTHRLLLFKRFFTKIDMFDVNYVDFEDVKIKQGFFTSTLFVTSGDGRSCTITSVVTDQALKIYRLCQDIETKARMARRQFQLEENRSRTTQFQVSNFVAGTDAPKVLSRQVQQEYLTHCDLSQIGDEERNPFRLGE
jgi:hypothetical protein